MASTSLSSREERRKRIVDRGSDRLALITGQAQSIPTPPRLPTHTTDPSASAEDDYRHPLLAKQSKPKAAIQGKDEASSGALPKHDPKNVADSGLPSKKVETPNNDQVIMKSPSLEIGSRSAEIPPSSVTSEVHQPPNPHRNLSSLLDPRLITYVVSATERLRLLCSTAAGFLVVLSYTGFPLLGNRIFKNILILSPLYLLLLTNASVVLAQIMIGKSLRPGRVGNENPPPNDGADWVAQVGTSLEMGYLMMKVMDAMMIDCSLYAIVVVCCISLVQMFF